MATLKKAAETIINTCMKLKKEESCFIITDKKRLSIAKALEKAALLVSPKQEVSDEMVYHDMIIIATTQSLSHTNARKRALASGARLASMPGITKDMMERVIVLDYARMQKMTEKVSRAMRGVDKVRIMTKKGTDLAFSIKGREPRGDDSGIYDKPEKWGNLPSGECYIAPLEGTGNGTLAVDLSVGGQGMVDHVFRITVKNGYATEITDGKISGQFKGLLDKVGGESRNLAEFGIGTNDQAKITGNVLEDEKVLGTCHIAFGNNISFGGKVYVPLHIDCVIDKPTIFFDGKKVMGEGTFLL